MMEAATFASAIGTFLAALRPLPPVLIGFAVVYFFWGAVRFINSAGDEAKRREGKEGMLWGLIALFVIIAVWSLVGALFTGLGFSTGSDARIDQAGLDRLF